MDAAGRMLTVTPASQRSHSYPQLLVLEDQPAEASRISFSYSKDGVVHQFEAARLESGKWSVDADAIFDESGAGAYAFNYEVYNSAGIKINAAQGGFSISGSGGLYGLSHTNVEQDPVYHTSLANLLSLDVLNGSRMAESVNVTSQTYDNFGNIITETDERGNTRRLYYDIRDNLILKQEAETDITLSNGYIDRRSPETHYYYDIYGRNIGIKDANGNLTAQAWANDKVTTRYDAYTRTRISGYDALGDKRLTIDEDGFSNNLSYSYSDGYFTVTMNGTGVLGDTVYTYQSDGDLVSTSKQAYVYSVSGYNAALGAGNYQTLTSINTFDALGRTLSQTSFGGLVTSYSYQNGGAGGVGGIVRVKLDGNTANSQNYSQEIIELNHMPTEVVDEIDYFGRVVAHKDMSRRQYTYVYNDGGWLMSQASDAGQDIHYRYYSSGRVRQIDDLATNSFTSFEYDEHGNVTYEAHGTYANDEALNYLQQTRMSYDEQNRLVSAEDPQYNIYYEYDAVGNRMHVKADYLRIGGDVVPGTRDSQDYWYEYDKLNRFTISQGSLNGPRAQSANDNSVKVVRDNGYKIGYHNNGRRQISIYGDQATTETYTYDANGFLRDTLVDGVLRARRTNLGDGKLLEFEEYHRRDELDIYVSLFQMLSVSPDGPADEMIRTKIDAYRYNADGQESYIFDMIENGEVGVLNTYDAAGNMHRVGSFDEDNNYSFTTYIYEYWDDYKRTMIIADNESTQAGISNLTYDVNGNLESVADSYSGRRMTYATNHKGQILKRVETGSVKGSDYRRIQQYYYANGINIGDAGDFGPSRTDYAQRLADTADDYRAKGYNTDSVKAKKALANELKDKRKERLLTPVYSGDFDGNYMAVDPSSSSPGTYTVQAGDTLQSIAGNYFGDGSLWYLIADANGLDSTLSLTPGMELVMPASINNIHNNSETFRPYDAGLAIGNIQPEQPPVPPVPKGSGCVKIVQIVVRVVVSMYVGAVVGGGILGAYIGNFLGEVASQGVAILAGEQSGINWEAARDAGKNAAIGSLVFGGLNPDGAVNPDDLTSWSRISSAALQQGSNQFIQSALTQLLEDRHVNWTEAARAGVIGGVTGGIVEGISIAASAESLSAYNRGQSDPIGSSNRVLQNGFNSFLRGGISARVGDALYSDKKYDTNDEVFRNIAMNAFGSAVGNAIAGDIELVQQRSAAVQKADRSWQLENLLGIRNPFAVRGDTSFLGTAFEGPLSVRQRELKTLVDAGVMTPKAALEFDMEESDELANVPFGIRAPQGSDLMNADGGMWLAALDPRGINTPAERILTLGPVMHPDADSYLIDDNSLGQGILSAYRDEFGHGDLQIVDPNEDGFLSTAERYLSNTGTTLEHTSDPAREMFGGLMYAIKEDLGMSALADGVVALGNSLVDSAILFGEQLEYIATMGYSGRPTTLDAILDLERMGSQKVASIYNAVRDGDPARIGDELSPLYTMALTGEAGIFARYGIGRVGGDVPNTSSATRARIEANIAESRAARNSSNIDIFHAKSVQIESGYNADDWLRGSLKKGDVIYSLSPNRKPEFFTSLETLQAGSFDSSAVSRALQVKEHPIFGYRPDVTGYRVTQDFDVLFGKTRANPQFGPGGGDQYLIRDYGKYLEPITTIDLKR
jgi:YD repeat-containing protein